VSKLAAHVICDLQGVPSTSVALPDERPTRLSFLSLGSDVDCGWADGAPGASLPIRMTEGDC
jgi:hypothetical protein